MKLEDYIIPDPIAPELIGGILPKNRLTLMHGAQGSGKTYSLIKMLNTEGISPVYLDFDHTDGISNLNYTRINSTFFNKMLSKEECVDLKGKVVVLDTYSRVHADLLTKGLTEKGIFNVFEELITFYDITFVVIGHTRAFVGKDGIFQDNMHLVRGCSEELFLEKTVYKKNKAGDPRVTFTLHVCKGRGSGGAKPIDNWMR